MIYTELNKQYLTLWLPALCLFIIAATGFYFIPLLSTSKTLSSLILFLLTFTLIAIAFLFYYKYALINCHCTIDEKKITCNLHQTTFIYPQQKQELNWQNISQIARIDDKHNTNYYLTCKAPSRTIILQQPYIEPQNDTIWQQLQINAQLHNIPLKETFYDNTPPPKEIAIILFTIILSIFIDIGWYLHPDISINKIIFIVLINIITLYLGIKWIKNRKA